MMQEIFERIDNDDLFFWTIIGVLAVFFLSLFLFVALSLEKREQEWHRRKVSEQEDDKNEFSKIGIKF